LLGYDIVDGQDALHRAALLAKDEEALFALGTRRVDASSHPDESLSQLATQLRNGDKVALDPLVLGLDHLGEAIFAGGVILGRVSSCIAGSHGGGSLSFLFGFLGG